MELRPVQDRVLVKRTQREDKTSGGIVIPETAKEKPVEGEVIAVGPGKVSGEGTLMKMAVKAGDRVLFSKYAGTQVSLLGDDYLVMREDEILAIIEK